MFVGHMKDRYKQIRYCHVDNQVMRHSSHSAVLAYDRTSREIVMANKYNVVRVKRFCGVYSPSSWHSDDRLCSSFESKGPVEMFVLKFMS